MGPTGITVIPGMMHKGHPTSSAFLPETQYLNLIIRVHSVNPNWAAINKMYSSQKVKVMKDKLKNHSRLKEPKETQ